MHVLIIGGGVIGLMSALELSHAGCQVTVLDQQDFGQAASWAGGGILSTMYPWRYRPAVNALARHGKVLYQQWQPVLYAETGMNIEIHPSGMLILDQQDFDTGLGWAQHDHDAQQQAQYLQSTPLHQLCPQLNQTIEQGLWFEQLANIRNPRLLKTLITYLHAQPNVRMVSHIRVQQLVQQHGRIEAVLDDQQQRWQADAYVIASGAWSGLLSEQLGWQLPVRPIQGQMILFKAPANWLGQMVMYKGTYLIPRQDGHIVCGSSMQDVGFNTDINPVIGQQLKQAALDILPGLAAMPIVKAWAGLRPASPLGIPFIGRTATLDNLWLNTGHFRNGLVMAPVAARMLREQMLGQPLSIDDAAYQPGRLIQAQHNSTTPTAESSNRLIQQSSPATD